jgi:autotransporter-associated beta strand protein
MKKLIDYKSRFRILKGGKISLLVSALLTSTIISQSSADTIVNDGNGDMGVFVGSQFFTNTNTSLDSYTGSSDNLTVGTVDDTTIFTGYYTEGGAGSGGGAGLGGVFFVNEGSALTLQNTIFKFNTVKGGEGGSLPAQTISDTFVYINQTSLSLTGYEAQSVTPNLSYSGGTYSFDTLNVATGTSLLNEGSPINFSELGGSSSTISTTTENTVALSSSVDVSNITSITSDTTTGYSISGDTITFDYVISDDGNGNVTYNDALIQTVKDSIKFNGLVAVNNGTNFDSATIETVNYDSDGNISSVTLSDSLSVAGSTLDVIPLTKFETSPYIINQVTNEITVTGSMRGFTEGMLIYDQDGVSTGATITNVETTVDGDYVITVDDASSVVGATSITAKSSPFINSSTIQLSSPNADFINASEVDINGTTYSISNYDNNTGVLTLGSSVSASVIESIESGDEVLAARLSTVTLSGNTITLNDDGQNFVAGMQLGDTGLTISSVSKSNGEIIIVASGDVTGLDTTKIVATDPLTTGGSLNNLASIVSGTVGDDGNNGFDSNYYTSFFNEGEGGEGTQGYAGGDGTNAAGGDGGDGGNGSNGLPVNPQLMSELWGATGDFVDAIGDLAGSIAPDGFPPVPDYADIPGNVITVAAASVDLATAIFNTVIWAENLNNGIAGMGGAGGDGGDGGTGDEFFGGGAAGDGGNGGEGALSFTDGGDGGEGGLGGYGGFGAGGGSGGAGGDAGSTGAANDGDPGDGGVAGFGAGDGSNGDGLYGTGGSGFGGAIFVRDGATLNITGNALFEDNTSIAGSSNNSGEQGESAGSAIFMMKGSSVNLMPGYGNTIIFNEDIADNSGSTYDSASFAAGAGADIHIAGNGGLVEFNAENTYSGRTYLEGGTLKAELGVGINDDSKISFNGSAVGTTTTNPLDTNILTLNSVGTLLLDSDLTDKRVGFQSFEVEWSGSGGFASGLEEGAIVNFGEIMQGVGQELTWGVNSFFESENNATLTFGSEYSLGSVEFQNNVDINGNTARVAVYNLNLGEENTAPSSAVLSGDWTNGDLVIGSSIVTDLYDAYNGYLYLSGTNSIDNLTILSGTNTTTADATISSGVATNTKLYGGTLILNTDETLGTVSVDNGAVLNSLQDINVSSTINNDGTMIVNTATFNNNITNNGSIANGGAVTLVNADVTNNNFWNQIGTLSANNISNTTGSSWYAQNNIDVSGTLDNDGTIYTGQKDSNQDWITLENSSDTIITVNALTGNGTFDISNSNLEINQSGTSTFDGSISGNGSLEKSGVGSLILTDAHTFTGGLDVTAGTIETTTAGTFADTLDIKVYEDATFIAGVEDTVGSVTVDGVSDGFADGLYTMNANITTQTSFTNNGDLELNANLTTGTDFENNRTTELTADRTITTTGGLKGSSTGSIQVTNSATELNLVQSGNTTYSGAIQGEGSFVKNGEGTLILDGNANSINLDSGTTVNNGILQTSSQNVFALNQNITVSTTGELYVETGSQDVNSVTNNGTVQLNDDLTVVTLTNSTTGTLNQEANITSTTSSDIDGNWNLTGDDSTDTRVLKTVTLTGDANVTLVDYLSTPSNLEINQSGTSTFDGSISGNGSVEKSGLGSLTLTAVQTFSGDLNVTSGTLTTASNAVFNDNVDINVTGTGTKFVSNVTDTVKSVSIGTGAIYELNADLETTATISNDGIINVDTEQTITTVGLSSTADTGEINTDAILTLNQSGTSIYSGSILGTGDFIKDGDGTLVLDGTSSSVDIDGIFIIENGTVGLDGANIFADTMAVQVSTSGIMELITGDQSIDSLAGTGTIYLNENQLYVENGGQFTGDILGNGTIDIQSGDFTVTNNVVSEDGTYVANDTANTTVDNSGNFSFKKVELLTGSTTNVIGSMEGTEDIVVQSGANVHLGDNTDPDNSENGTIITPSLELSGTLSGQGTIDGTLYVKNQATLAPGNSPGSIAAQDLVLENGSLTEIEIYNSETSGVTYDQVIVGNTMIIEDGATLDIVKYNDAILTSPSELDMGETVDIFDVKAGNVTGSFSTINSNYTNDIIFNVATGDVIGLGTTSISDFLVAVGTNSNQRSILSSVQTLNTAGVAQFYGGNLIPSLTSVYGNLVDTNNVFDKFSPESYASLSEQAKVGIIDSQVELPLDISSSKDGLSLDLINSFYESENDNNFANYELRNQGVRISHIENNDSFLIMNSFQADKREINSKYLESKTDGFNFATGIVVPFSNTGFSFRAQANVLTQTSDNTRDTISSVSRAEGIDAKASSGGIGIGYFNNSNNMQFEASLDGSVYNVKVDGFIETNSDKLDGLTVANQSSNGTILTAKLGVNYMLTNNFSINGNLGYQNINSDDTDITARVSTESQSFEVTNPGLGNSNMILGTGFKYSLDESFELKGSVTLKGDQSLNQSVDYKIGLKYIF